MDEYRIDWAYESVYKFQEDKDAYIFIGSFLGFGISFEDSMEQAVEKVKQKEHGDWMDSLPKEEFQIAVRAQIAIYNTLKTEEVET